MPGREPPASSGCGRGSGRAGWLPASGTHGSSPVPGAGRALAGGRAPEPAESAPPSPRAPPSGAAGSGSGAVPGADGSSALGPGPRPHDLPPALGAPPAPAPRPAGAPFALRVLSGAPRFHSVGIGSQAEAAAAYPKCDLGASSFPRGTLSLVLTFEMGHRGACKVGLRMQGRDVQGPGTQ